ncbi:MAG: hypothetical protein R3250_17965, partial [Melioribacteraceae bacterium]|nr:hypothetical protein [Melioribacteraceae bacterium]
DPTSTLLVGPMIIKLPDGNFLLGNDRILQKITAEGDSLWRIDTGFKVSAIKSTKESRVIAAGYRKFAVINMEGTIEYIQSLNFTVDSGDNTKDEGYIFLSNGNHLTKTDPLGNILWEKEILKSGNYVSSTSDSGIVMTGSIFDNLRLLKTDSDGEFTSLFIQNQESYTLLPTFEKFIIEWYSSRIENINIEYTIDNGASWMEVVSNYPADSGYYEWNVPNTPSDSCNIRITASDNPLIVHMLDSFFSIMTIKNYDYISINEILMWIGNNGMGSHDPVTDNSGFYWPGGENAKTASIFADGLMWGGKVENEIRVNGCTYRYGLKPGKILENGLPDDPKLSKYKIFKIRKDWESLPDNSIKNRFEYDYNNWPGDLGAPYIDNNGDGEYTKGIDTPKFIGDEVLFYVANDKDTITSRFTYGSDPIGLEFQTTVWGFDTDDFLKDVVFKKYKMINN